MVTTEEAIRYDSALMLRSGDGTLQPFSRDRLLISLYKSLAHRQTAADDATALCSTILTQVRQSADIGACIDQRALVEATITCLSRFDAAAATHYQAYHL